MRNGDTKIFALRVTDAKIFRIENRWCKTDAKFFALSFGDVKILAVRIADAKNFHTKKR